VSSLDIFDEMLLLTKANPSMSTLLHGLRFTARGLRHPPTLHRYVAKPIGRRRAFSATVPTQDDEPANPKYEEAIQKVDRSKGNMRQRFEQDMDKMLAEQDEELEEDEDDVMGNLSELMGEWDEEFDELSDPPPQRGKVQVSDSFHNYGEPNDEDQPMELDDEGDDEDVTDDYSNMTVLAHGELQQHQEIRHYARLAAWDLPLLSSE